MRATNDSQRKAPYPCRRRWEDAVQWWLVQASSVLSESTSTKRPHLVLWTVHLRTLEGRISAAPLTAPRGASATPPSEVAVCARERRRRRARKKTGARDGKGKGFLSRPQMERRGERHRTRVHELSTKGQSFFNETP